MKKPFDNKLSYLVAVIRLSVVLNVIVVSAILAGADLIKNSLSIILFA